MTKNVGTVDAGIRVVLACVLLFLAATYNSRPLPALALALGALILLGTALSRSCPLYRLLGIDGHPRPPHPSGT